MQIHCCKIKFGLSVLLVCIKFGSELKCNQFYIVVGLFANFLEA